MEFGFTEEEEAFRQEVRKFLDKEMPQDSIIPIVNLAEDLYRDDVWQLHKVMARKLGEKGWLSLDWPRECGGQGLSPMYSAIFQEEMRYRGAPGWDPQGVSMVAPLLIHFGTEEQKKEHLPPIARGEVFWCEGYSEPQVGSDLASVQTMAVEDGDAFVVNGQKLWTSGAHVTDWCQLVARTNPNAPKKYQGLTHFLVDMKTPGIEVRPIRDICNGRGLCEVFFDNVRIPNENIVGQKDHGWETALALLSFERGLDAGSTGLMRAFFDLMLRYLKEHHLTDKPAVRQNLANVFIEMETARLLAYKVVWSACKGLPAGTPASMSKLFSSEANQRCANAMMKMLGSYGLLAEDSRAAVLHGRITQWYFQSFSSTLARGTSEIQRNILATRDLRLPRS
jgi:alkylation response protein AidB-like acyl-CoA dehydrogenase